MAMFHNHRGVGSKRWQTAVLFITAAWLLTACLGLSRQDDTPAPVSPYVGQVELICSDACRARGQCGTAGDGSTQILASSIAPNVESQDVLFLQGSRAAIQATENVSLQSISNPDQIISLPFYSILLNDGTVSGWVPEWCVVPVN